MNIFYLHKNPVTAAEMSCDKHVDQNDFRKCSTIINLS